MSKSVPLVLGKSNGNKVKIGLPSLCAYDSDDDEDEIEEQPKLKNLNPVKEESKPRSGLLSMLPPPKSSAKVLTKKTDTSKPVFFREDLYHKAKKLKQDEESDVIPTNNGKLGSYLEYQHEDPEPFADEHQDKEEDDSEISDIEEKKEVRVEEREEDFVDETKPAAPVAFDQDALVKLCGSQGKRKGVDSIELLNVGVNEIVGNNRSELVKQITSDYRPPSNKDYFGSSSRKTHHVTYLAKVAIERDQELKESWAQSKFNRQQARQKYGF